MSHCSIFCCVFYLCLAAISSWFFSLASSQCSQEAYRIGRGRWRKPPLNEIDSTTKMYFLLFSHFLCAYLSLNLRQIFQFRLVLRSPGRHERLAFQLYGAVGVPFSVVNLPFCNAGTGSRVWCVLDKHSPLGTPQPTGSLSGLYTFPR